MSTDVDAVFAEWQRVFRKPYAKLTPERERRIRARLKDYSVERLFRAIAGCKRSPHHQGNNSTGTKYEDLELICRDGKHVEMFEEMAPQASNGSAIKLKTPAELVAEVDAEFEAGNG